MKLKKILYVIGPPRSGSTLVYNSICSSKIFNPSLPENHLVPNLIKYFLSQLNRNQSKEKNLIFNSNDDIRLYFQECIEIFFSKVGNKYNTKNLCLKSIMFASNIHIMNILFPKISYVMLVRDPKDIISSMLKVSQKQIDLNLNPQYPRNMKILSEFINEKYLNFFNQNNSNFYKNSVFFLKYEDFVLDQKNILNKIMKKFNIDYSFQNNHDYWSNSLNMTKLIDNPFESNLWTKPITDKRIGNFKDILTSDEIEEVNVFCKQLINFFRY